MLSPSEIISLGVIALIIVLLITPFRGSKNEEDLDD